MGYFQSTENIPEKHGVYAAFAQNEMGSPRLLYIGRAFKTNNLKKRIQEHIDNDHNDERWKEHYNPRKEAISYSYAEIEDDDIIPDIEKALIYRNKPEINYQDVENNNIEAQSVMLRCAGDKGCLKTAVILIKE